MARNQLRAAHGLASASASSGEIAHKSAAYVHYAESHVRHAWKYANMFDKQMPCSAGIVTHYRVSRRPQASAGRRHQAAFLNIFGRSYLIQLGLICRRPCAAARSS